ncbi:MAG: hypothetical protein ACTSXC_00830 [Candidatus Freyarchaeota archaeon]|mgnify:CR=1 FL=1
MVRKVKVAGKIVHICEICGLGYGDEETAKSCQEYCSAYNVCSLEIARKAIFFPTKVKAKY